MPCFQNQLYRLFQQIIFIDVAIIYALLSFVGTLYIAKYLGGEL